MDRCALFVDAGYVLADGAMAVHGTRRRESVSWDYPGLLGLLSELATEQTKLPVLRCYWYESTVEGRRSADHDTLADLPGVKLRVSKMRPGRREGVEGEIHRDLTTLARNKAVSDVMLVSAEEDLAQVIADVQDMGLRVTLLHVAAGAERELPRALRQESDDIVEVSAEQLRPYVELISGAEPPRPDEAEETSRPAAAGNLNGTGYNGNGHATPVRAAAYGQPQAGREQTPPPPVPVAPAAGVSDYPQAGEAPAADQPAQPKAQPSAADAAQPDSGAPEPAAAADYPAAADLAAGVDYSASVDYGAPAEQAGARDYQSALDYGAAPEYGVPDYAPPAAAGGLAVPREEPYGAPVALPATAAEDRPAADRDRDQDRLAVPSRGGADYSGYAPGGVRDQYQRDSMRREPAGGDMGVRLQPVPIALPTGNSAQVRRLPTRGPGPGGPNPGPSLAGPPPASAPQPGLQHQPGPQQPGMPPAGPAEGPLGPQPGGPQPGGLAPGRRLSIGQPTGGQPAAPMAPVVPMDGNGMGYSAPRGITYGGPRPVSSNPGGPAGLASQGGPGTVPGLGGPAGPGPVPPGNQPPAPSLSAPSAPLSPGGPQDLAGPAGFGSPGSHPAAGPGVSLGDAVQSAHEEGQAFGESVARDAPALWLEAVLARKPRMPSDLEARLLQGSALPIDFLLHDEVRLALRRGFWDALERARR